MFEIYIKNDDGNWAEIGGCYPYVFPDAVIFATEEEALDMIAELKKLGEEWADWVAHRYPLKKLGEEWADGEYRVVPVTGDGLIKAKL